MSLFSNDMRVANTATPSFASEANVGQFGWTSADSAHYNQLIQYVDECRKIWLNLEEKILYVESILENVSNIDDQVKYIEQMTHAVSQWRNEVISVRDQIYTLYDEVRPMYNDFVAKYPEVSEKHAEVVKMHGETLDAAIAAAHSENSAAVSAQEAKDVAEELRKGQVYRGTWNIESNASYPSKPDTNSVWDVVLNEGSLEYKFDNKTWYWGDRLLYLKDNNAFTQIEAGGSVTSVNGKKGAVTITYTDVHAAPEGFGLGGYGESLSAKSANDTNGSGFYAVYSGTTDTPYTSNGPSGSQIMNMEWGAAGATQIFSAYTADRIHFRRKYQSNWLPWVEFYTTAKKPTPSELGAVNKAGDTITGSLIFDNARPVLNNNVMMGANNAAVLRDHGNGNVTLSASVSSSGTPGVLYIGYNAGLTGTAGYNTARVTLESPLLWKNSTTLVNDQGKVPVGVVDGAVKKAGDEMSGVLSVYQNNVTKAKILAGTTSGIMMTDKNDVQKWFSYYDSESSQYRIAEYVNGAYVGPRFQLGAGGAFTMEGTGSTVLTLNSTADTGTRILSRQSGAQDWYVGRANAAGDVAFYSYQHSAGVILRGDKIEFTKNPMYNSNQIYHAGSLQPRLPNAGGMTNSTNFLQSGFHQFYTDTSSTGFPGNLTGVGVNIVRNQATSSTTTGSDGVGSLFIPNTGRNEMFLRNYNGGSGSWTSAHGWSAIMMTKPLGTSDLNTLADVIYHGEWYQDTTANATTARNYPIAEAGKLSITGGPYGAMQEYTSFSTGRKFVRGKSGTGTSSWYTWKEVGGVKDHCSAYRINAQTIAAGATGILVPGVFPSAQGITSTNGDFIILKTGTYKIEWGFTIEPQTVNQNGVGSIFVNGVQTYNAMIYNYCPASGSGTQMGTGSTSITVQLNSGDRLSFRVQAVNNTTVRIYQAGYMNITQL